MTDLATPTTDQRPLCTCHQVPMTKRGRDKKTGAQHWTCTIENRARVAAHRRTPEGRAQNVRASMRFQATPKGRAYVQARQRDYAKTPKGRAVQARLRAQGGFELVAIPATHPFASMRQPSSGKVLAYRLVAAETLGRPLLPAEVVHHLQPLEGGSGDRRDRRPENLAVFPADADHQRNHRALVRLERALAGTGLTTQAELLERGRLILDSPVNLTAEPS